MVRLFLLYFLTKYMKTFLIKIASAIGATALIYLVSLLTTGDSLWCFKDKDTCAIDQMVHYREQRDIKIKEEEERHKTSLASINSYYNDQKINPLKLSLSAGAILKEAKEGDKRNVPQEFLTLKGSLIPIAQADNGDGWTQDDEIKDQSSITKDQSTEKTLRYQALLTSFGSPYANVDIGAYCKEANVPQEQCDVLVGIGHSESKSGTDFTSSTLPKAEAIRLGQEVYHNPVGIKLCREVPVVYLSPFSGDLIKSSTECPEFSKKPDENGMWIQRYDSWEQFWITYIYQMKRGYLDKGATTPESISKCYVRGDCVTVKTGWVNNVKFFTAKL